MIEGFCGRLDWTIQYRKMNKHQVGELAGLKRGHIDHIVSGRRANVSAETLIRLRRVLRVSIDWLLTGDGVPLLEESPIVDPTPFFGAVDGAVAEMKAKLQAAAEKAAAAPAKKAGPPPAAPATPAAAPKKLRARRDP